MGILTRRSFLKTSATVAVASAALAAESPAPATAKAGLQAAVAAIDITPPAGTPMWGYSERKGPATGVLDPLHARALILKSGDETTALVTLDLGRVPRVTALNRIRERVAKAGVKHVIFTASHTHGGPVLEDDAAPFAKMIEDRIGKCIETAAAQLKPAQIGWGTTTIDVCHNRRKMLDDGTCLMLWRNEAKIPTEPLDHEATIIKVDTADGKPLAILVNYACHAVVLGWDNLQFTADYVGEMCRLVKEKTGAECMFLQGAAGDINPYLDKTPLDKGGIESMRGVGKTCADTVIAAAGSIKAGAAQPSLVYAEKMVPVGTRWDFKDPDQAKVFRAILGDGYDKYIANIPPDLPVPLAVLLINNELALAAMPGEFFVQFQIDLKTGSPVKKSLLVGYANDYHAYFPTIKGSAAGGYGATVATYAGLGAGDKLVMESQIMTGKLAGRIRDKAVPTDFILKEEGS